MIANSNANALARLPNLGAKSAALLSAAGVDSEAELRRLGAVEAYLRVRRVTPRVSLNLLWAIEGALSGLRWQRVAREERTRLLLLLDEKLKHEP
jgi:DNA transformation protein and related proteins